MEYCFYSNPSETQYLFERFRRPSKQLPLANNYSFADFENDNDSFPFITTVFKTSYDVIKAYYGILRNASNMKGYWGGCGSIGNSLQPYSYAYELLSVVAKKKISFLEFVNSFRGLGSISLLKLQCAFIPPGTPSNICYYMFEIESITGPSQKDDLAYKRGGSYFVYQYGLITVSNDSNNGWKIEAINTLPEDFLCAPEHGWIYSAKYVVTFVYKDWYQLIDTINHIEQKCDMISIYASGGFNQYRFDFIQLTNGYDILLHENIFVNEDWVEINLLKLQDQGLKLTILNQNLTA